MRYHKFDVRAIGLAAMVLLNCACSGREESGGDTPTADAAVTFSTDVDEPQVTRVTTGSIDNLDALQSLPEGFGVFGYLTETEPWATAGASAVPNFMNNQPVTWGYPNPIMKTVDGVEVVDEEKSTKAWFYTPPKYWPNYSGNDDNGENAPRYISFFAYAPFVERDELTGTNVTELPGKDKSPHLVYTLGSTNHQVDLLWANCIDAKRNGRGLIEVNDDGTIKQYQKVPLTFHHALSCVEVYVQRIYDEQTYSGKVPTADADKDQEKQTKLFVGKLAMASEPALYKTGTLHLDKQPDKDKDNLWTFAGAAEAQRDYTETMFDEHVGGTDRPESEANLRYIRNYELNKWDREGYGVDSVERRLFTSGSLFFFPQEVTLTPTLTFSMLTRDEELAQNTLTDASGRTFSRIVNTVTGNSVKIKFEPGKKYKLVIHIAAEHIEFEVASVEDWDFPMRFKPTVEVYKDTTYNKTLNDEN